MFYLFTRWTGPLCLTLVLLNALVIKWRSASMIRERPSLKKGYRQLVWGYLVLWGLPCLVLTFGMSVGSIPVIWHYFNPSGGNVYVLAFYITGAIVLVAQGIWIYFLGGADFVVKYYYPVARRSRVTSTPLISTPRGVKIRFALSTLGALIAFVVLWRMGADFMHFPPIY